MAFMGPSIPGHKDPGQSDTPLGPIGQGYGPGRGAGIADRSFPCNSTAPVG